MKVWTRVSVCFAAALVMLFASASLAPLRSASVRMWAIAFSPDGNRLASASADKTVRLWETASVNEVGVPRGHTARITKVAFSPDSALLTSIADDDAPRVWDVAKTNAEGEPKRAVRQTGTVRFYDTQKGYGFIIPDDLGNDIFVHSNEVERSGIGALIEGMRISFETEPGMRGKAKAVNLQQVGTGTTELPKPPELPDKSTNPLSSSETSDPAKTNVESEPKKAAADGSPEEEWKVCSSSEFVNSMKAIDACTRLIAQANAIPASRRAEAHFRRGQLKEQLLSLKSPDKAQQAAILEDYNAAIGLDQSRPPVYLARALLTVNMGGDRQQAIADLSEVIRLDPGIARAHLVRGLQYAKLGDLDRALTDLTKSIELAPDSAAYELRAEIYEKKDRMEQAFADLDAAVRLAPKNSFTADILKEKRGRIGRPLANYNAERGRVAAQNGDTDLAVLDFNTALDYDPYNWRANFGRGAIYLQRGDLDKARADLRTATQEFTRAKPGDWPAEIATAHVWLGEIYEKQRRLNDALLEYDEALKAHQALKDAEGIRARADRLRSQVK